MPEEEGKRTSVLLQEYHFEVLERIGDVWPIARRNRSAAVRVAIEQIAHQMDSPGRAMLTWAVWESNQRIAANLGIDLSDIVERLESNGDKNDATE